MDKHSVPESLDALTTELGRLDSLVTASEWQRAALVYAYTRKSPGGRPGGNPTTSREVLSIVGFSKLGIVGLKSQDSVRRYHDAWADAVEQGTVEPTYPGCTFIPPDLPFPRSTTLVAVPTPDTGPVEPAAFEDESAGFEAEIEPEKSAPSPRSAPSRAAEPNDVYDDEADADAGNGELGSDIRGYVLRAQQVLIEALERWIVVGGELPDAARSEVRAELYCLIDATHAVLDVAEGKRSVDDALAELIRFPDKTG